MFKYTTAKDSLSINQHNKLNKLMRSKICVFVSSCSPKHTER